MHLYPLCSAQPVSCLYTQRILLLAGLPRPPLSQMWELYTGTPPWVVNDLGDLAPHEGFPTLDAACPAPYAELCSACLSRWAI